MNNYRVRSIAPEESPWIDFEGDDHYQVAADIIGDRDAIYRGLQRQNLKVEKEGQPCTMYVSLLEIQEKNSDGTFGPSITTHARYFFAGLARKGGIKHPSTSDSLTHLARMVRWDRPVEELEANFPWDLEDSEWTRSWE